MTQEDGFFSTLSAHGLYPTASGSNVQQREHNVYMYTTETETVSLGSRLFYNDV